MRAWILLLITCCGSPHTTTDAAVRDANHADAGVDVATRPIQFVQAASTFASPCNDTQTVAQFSPR